MSTYPSRFEYSRSARALADRLAAEQAPPEVYAAASYEWVGAMNDLIDEMSS